MKTWADVIQEERKRVGAFANAVACCLSWQALQAEFDDGPCGDVPLEIGTESFYNTKAFMWTPSRVYFVCLDGHNGYDAYGISSELRNPP